jgi:general secretion pathway protein H
MARGAVSSEGFTLLEMLIVLVIMSLLMTLVPPLLSNALPSLTLKTVANDLLQDLNYVRDIAILKGKKTQVVINTNAGSYSSEEKYQKKEQVLPNNIKISTSHIGLRVVNDDSPVIAFFADGSSSGGIITLSNNERSLSLIVDWITGSVSLREGHLSE